MSNIISDGNAKPGSDNNVKIPMRNIANRNERFLARGNNNWC